MRPVWKGLALACVVVGLIVAAVILVRQNVFAERALPILTEQRDQIAQLTIRYGQDTIGFTKTPDGAWLVSSAGDAPVREALVETLLDDLANMRLVEREEGAPALPSRLDAEKSYAIALADSAGKGLALITLQPEAGSEDGQALLVQDAGQPMLVSHVPEIPLSAERWADLAIPTLAPERVRVLRVMTPDARLATFERASASAAFQRVEADAGAPVNAEAVRQAVEALGNLRSEQVRPANDLAWGGATMVMAETFDGVVLTLLGARDDVHNDSGVWVRVNAHHAPQGSAKTAEAEAEALNRMRAFAFLLPSDVAAHLFGVAGS